MPIVINVDSTDSNISQELKGSRTFDQNEIRLGRSPESDIMLSDKTISGNHAVIKLKRVNNVAKLFICDSGSSNGTFLEDNLIKPNTDTEIQENQRLVIGPFIITLKLDDLGETTSDPTAATGSFDNSELVQENGAAGLEREDLEQYDRELQIKRNIHGQLIKRLDLRRKDIIALSDVDLRKKAEAVVEQILVDLRWQLPEGLNRNRLISEVLDEALGLGPLEVLLADEAVSEIMLNSYNMIYAERGGRLELSDLRFSGEPAVLAAIERILAPIGRRIDESSPLVDARLKDGSRVNAVIRPLALKGPCITIRKFAKDPLSIDDLVRFNSVSQGMADFLGLAVNNRLNIVISGGTGSGKTTLLNIVASFIPDGERVITVEDAAELKLPREHVISFETRPANLEGKGAVTIRDLVRNALRMRPDRIIVGECRGAEALDMLQAMNTGHDGSMTTGHANSPSDMVSRLETMVLTSGLDLPIRAVREQIASAVNLVVQQTRFSCGTRKVTAISEVVGMDYDDGTVVLQDVFNFRQHGYGDDGKVRGFHQATGYVPTFFRKMQERGVSVNPEVFNPDIEH